jgi:hypothetical protein
VKSIIFKSIVKLTCVIGVLSFLSCSKSNTTSVQKMSSSATDFSALYSYAADEYQVTFSALAKTTHFTLDDVNSEGIKSKIVNDIKANVKFLFGPLTHRDIGGQKLNFVITPDWTLAKMNGDTLEVPYIYTGVWIISKKLISPNSVMNLPLPYDVAKVYTPKWLSCTDSAPDHQTESFFWYFWDPTRKGCDHKIDQEYQIITVRLGEQTVNQTESYPEYSKMIQSNGVENNLQMTFAFGYVEDAEDSFPDTDNDYGMSEFRKFVKFMDQEAKKLNLRKIEILQKEYLNHDYPDKKIGYSYQGFKNNVALNIKVVAAANIDQMELFAKSYAHDHDAFFGWFGHSRVGSGFDANNFASMLRWNPEYYTLSSNYQLIYWAGCNSYSYYTLPFFDQKSALDKSVDPFGTKNLDIISNALPSLFSFNSNNAKVAYAAMINWENPTSFQTIVSTIEKNGLKSGYPVIVNVLGDEDNTKP